jgi:uncharacterized protein YceK
MQKFALILIVSVGFLGCGSSSSNGTAASDKLSASSFDCEKSFQSNWCSQNLEGSSSINSICSGDVFSDDLVWGTLYLTSTSTKSCLVDVGLGTKTVAISGCSSAVQKTYSSTDGAVDVFTCYNSSGSTVYIEGTLSNGQAFRAIHTE